MNEQEIQGHKPKRSTLLHYPQHSFESIILNVVNPDTAAEFKTLFEATIIDYLNKTDFECCASNNFKTRLEDFYNTIDYKKGQLNRYNQLIDFLLNDMLGDCDTSILSQHRDFIEELADMAKPNLNVRPDVIHTDEERRKAWLIHATIIISKIIFSGCERYREEIRRWEEAQTDPLLWDMYKLGL